MYQYLVLFIHSSNETIKEYKRRKHHQAAYGHGGVVGVPFLLVKEHTIKISPTVQEQ